MDYECFVKIKEKITPNLGQLKKFGMIIRILI